jgi:putative holliday junction resolvase
MKIVGLDLGDQWTGVALSDASCIIATPYATISARQHVSFLEALLVKESISTVVVGYPQTMRATESDQTRKVVREYERLKSRFPTVSWILIDERYTSKQAAALGKRTDKASRQAVHARAAAFILTLYLDQLHMQKALQ